MATLNQHYSSKNTGTTVRKTFMDREEIDRAIELTSPVKRSKLVCGIGVNDCSHATLIRIDGKIVPHRAYAAWEGMIKRCYSSSTQLRNPSYIGCTVCDEWLYFSNFFKWWKDNFVEGWQLDKDLLNPGNREYSPENCLYVPRCLNAFTNDRRESKGEVLIGINWCMRGKKFTARVCTGSGKRKYLGYFDSPEEAHLAWYDAKMEIAIGYKDLCDSIHPRLHSALIRKIESMKAVAK